MQRRAVMATVERLDEEVAAYLRKVAWQEYRSARERLRRAAPPASQGYAC
jgi:hypothetical protein